MSRRFLAFLACASLALGLTASALAADAKPAAAVNASGAFNAEVEMGSFQPHRGSGGQAAASQPITVSGNFVTAGQKFRLELSNSLTQEKQIYIVDAPAKKAWMLFPDTLTGISSDLSNFDHDGMLHRAQQFMGGNGSSAAPKEWGKAEKKTEVLNGQTVTHLIYTLPVDKNGQARGQVNLWQAADQTPVKLVMDRTGIKITVNFSNFKRGIQPASSLFTPEKKYKIRALAAGEAPPMPGGFGGGGTVHTHGSHS